MIISSTTLLVTQDVIAENFPNRIFNAERDQPREPKLFFWDNRVVVHAEDFFFEIDSAQKTATLMNCVGGRSLISLTTAFGKPFALAGTEDYYRLFHRSAKDDWDMIDVPPNAKGKEDQYFIAVGDKNSIVLLGQNSFRMFDGETWIYRPYKNDFHPNDEDVFALWNGDLYCGIDRGEFGGGLYKLIIATGEWSEIENEKPFSHVSDLCPTPDGNLKVVCGISHMGGVYGRISTLTTNGIENNWFISNHGNTDQRWEYKITDFTALRFSKEGEQLLFTPSLGLLVCRDDKWIRLTPDWNNHAYVSSFLALNDDEYILGTYDSGIAIINLKEKKEKLIRLATSFYEWKEK